jgi:hypothetical protein
MINSIKTHHSSLVQTVMFLNVKHPRELWQPARKARHNPLVSDAHLAAAFAAAKSCLRGPELWKILDPLVTEARYARLPAALAHGLPRTMLPPPPATIRLSGGARVPRVIFGTGCCGMDESRYDGAPSGEAADKKAMAIMAAALRAGVRFIDTAHMCKFGVWSMRVCVCACMPGRCRGEGEAKAITLDNIAHLILLCLRRHLDSLQTTTRT